MTTTVFFEKIKKEVQLFDPIALTEMEKVKLMDRVDVKYLIPLNLLPTILADARQHYRLLEINQERICPYQTLYYDTKDLTLYHQHQVGKQNRYKVRSRNYVGSNLQFFEVKLKNNRGRTIKKRIKINGINESYLSDDSSAFLGRISPLNPENLQGIMWVNYSRLTLVSKHTTERLTIDLQLTFKNNSKEVQFAQIAIAEIKQERMGASPILDILKKHHLKSGSISKYCFGIISLFENIKKNNFKKHLRRISKTLLQYESFTANAIA
ncbi:VTC domain-containing protein [Emticicia oligotrophica DSM 17448]|uniref:VTC domain-containing protein n=1 Tax=Emticicia oligotrophica (strain DSM 17448 / CIP 109782 / MTCC 6937 / GPTSA100-15) TaxID=929562 RepID=A0ABM5MY73_EMTOG|nr:MULTISPECIES: polyphosphate polymerase domain-containing protein [Emticicia]AFK02054.1 VTC domain-containing protein [Emticicia oligotrophica DSM 17448]